MSIVMARQPGDLQSQETAGSDPKGGQTGCGYAARVCNIVWYTDFEHY
jgi:hypothetical protein